MPVDPSGPREQRPDDPLAELVARYVEVVEAHGPSAGDEVLAREPELAPAARAQIERLRRMGLLAGAPSANPPWPEVAHYTVLERLGAGGMGEVYLAEQREPVRRRVALKVIKLGLESREVLARFEVERQALALMAHANIARVLEAGSTAQGQPYFAMEHVPGLAITTYCDQRRLGTAERLALVLQVCEAVQHAHYKGIVHRDLKPSNILVMEQDARAVPKIIDFGVAKAVAVGLGSGSVFTAQGMVVGTPEYMSPEQAGRGELDVDTRTDVYSLGVLLYELLTGTLPFSSERLRSGGLEQMLSIIRDEAPERPSTRISVQTPATARVAAAQSTDPASLRQNLRGDLDWIVLRALEKDRNRRYQTPATLADDLRRFLADQPVAARPPSVRYRVGKFVRRNRLAVGLTSAVVVALAVGLIVSSSYYRAAEASAVAAERARREAVAATEVAQVNFERAMQAVDDLLSRVGDTSLVHIPQMEGVRRDLLSRARSFYEAFAAQRADDPRVQVELAIAHDRVGRIESKLGDLGSAQRAYRKALAIIDQLRVAKPDDPRLLELHAGIQAHLAYSLKATSTTGVRDLLDASLATLRELDARLPPTRVRRHLIAEVCAFLAELEIARDPATAVELIHETIAQFDAAIADDATDLESAAKRTLARLALAQFEYRRRELAAARAALALADREAEELIARAPERIDLRRARCLLQDLLAGVLDSQDLSTEAVAAAREANLRWQALVEAFPLSLDFRASQAQSLNNAAAVLPDAEWAESAALSERAQSIYEDLCRARPTDTGYRRSLCVVLVSRGAVLAGQAGDLERGMPLLIRGCEEVARLVAEHPDNLDFVRLAVAAQSRLGQLRMRQSDSGAARAALQAAVTMARGSYERRTDSAESVDVYVGALLSLAKLDLQQRDADAAATAADLVLQLVREPAGRDASASIRRAFVDALNLRGSVAQQRGESAVLRNCCTELRTAARRPDELLLCATLAATSLRGHADDAWFKTQALEVLRSAVTAGLTGRARLAADVRWAELRDDPEFAAVLATIPD